MLRVFVMLQVSTCSQHLCCMNSPSYSCWHSRSLLWRFSFHLFFFAPFYCAFICIFNPTYVFRDSSFPSSLSWLYLCCLPSCRQAPDTSGGSFRLVWLRSANSRLSWAAGRVEQASSQERSVMNLLNFFISLLVFFSMSLVVFVFIGFSLIFETCSVIKQDYK